MSTKRQSLKYKFYTTHVIYFKVIPINIPNQDSHRSFWQFDRQIPSNENEHLSKFTIYNSSAQSSLNKRQSRFYTHVAYSNIFEYSSRSF